MNRIASRLVLAAALTTLSACSASEGNDGSEGNEEPTNQATVLTRAEQVAIIQKRIEATNTRNWDAWEALHTVDATRSAPELEQPLQGAAAMRFAIETLGKAFPDYHLELRQSFGEGEWLAVRIHTTGTMTGPLLLSEGVEVPPTGRHIEQDWSALVRFQGDKIAQFDEFYDQYTLMAQLGLVAE